MFHRCEFFISFLLKPSESNEAEYDGLLCKSDSYNFWMFLLSHITGPKEQIITGFALSSIQNKGLRCWN